MRPYDERLEQFLTRAAGVFAARGAQATTMRDLARATGMSLAGMYYYVRGKEELLYRIQDRCSRRMLAGAEEALGPLAHADPVERLQAFIRHHVAFSIAHAAEMRVLGKLPLHYIQLLDGLIADVAPAEAVADRRAATALLLGMMNAVDGETDAERVAGLVTRVFLGGFAPAPSPVHG